METNKQRTAAAKAAEAAKATQTLKAIKDESSNYPKILLTAVNEVGLDAVANYVLGRDSELAYQMLRSIKDLGTYRDDLVKKAAESPQHAALTLRNIPNVDNHQQILLASAGTLVKSQGTISGFNLLIQGLYIARFTVYWINKGIRYPKKGAQVKYSGRMALGSNETRKCSFFPTGDEPLEPNDEVWMYLNVIAGCGVQTPLRFTYDPNSSNIANFVATGTTTTAELHLR